MFNSQYVLLATESVRYLGCLSIGFVCYTNEHIKLSERVLSFNSD